MITLGIETSCDETAVAVIEDGKLLSSEVSSSVELHSAYGGVVPEIASRFHAEYIYPVAEKALNSAGKTIGEVGLVAVTQGPGLMGSLLVGIAFAKAICLALGVPMVGVDHLMAHIFSCFMTRDVAGKIKYPFIGMVVSGGHTSIYSVRSLQDISLIGRAIDDAAGEAFDKVAKILGLAYPGGPQVEKMAAEFSGDDDIDLPRALMRPEDNLDFSFSGLKTAVMYRWRGSEKNDAEKRKICYSFQRAVLEVIEKKALRAVSGLETGILAVGGGVVNNSVLRANLGSLCESSGIELYLPQKEYCGDNAAMVAFLGENLYANGCRSGTMMNAYPVSG
jgi:N6-L-threonylcarbamoyladenine synthase